MEECEYFDLNFIHPQTFFINKKIYLLKNACTKLDNEHVLIIDID